MSVPIDSKAIQRADALRFIATWASTYGSMGNEAREAIDKFTTELMRDKRKKGKPYARPEKVGPGTLNQTFTQHVGSDKYGYIVKGVEEHGTVITATGYDTMKGGFVDRKGDITLKWHPRLDQGRGQWVLLGEKYKPKGPYYAFGPAINYFDPSF
jgi:hypothetical protein